MGRRRFYVGLDLGQSHDFTAVSVVERAELAGEWDPVTFCHKKQVVLRLRHLDRVPLGTPYPEVVNRVAELTRSRELDGCCELVDMLRAARLNCTISAAMITGGTTESCSGGNYYVPKRDLITGLKIVLQRETLQIASGMQFGAALVKELAEMRVRVTAHGNEQFGAWREGSHDDLVFAVALSCWGVRKAYPWDCR
jgi:hypothetical protein